MGISQLGSLLIRNIKMKSYFIDNELGIRISKNKFDFVFMLECSTIYLPIQRYGDNEI